MHIHIHIYISFKITLASLGDVYIPNYLLSKETSQTQRGRSSRRASSINSGYSLAFFGKPALPGAAAAPEPSSLAPAFVSVVAGAPPLSSRGGAPSSADSARGGQGAGSAGSSVASRVMAVPGPAARAGAR